MAMDVGFQKGFGEVFNKHEALYNEVYRDGIADFAAWNQQRLNHQKRVDAYCAKKIAEGKQPWEIMKSMGEESWNEAYTASVKKQAELVALQILRNPLKNFCLALFLDHGTSGIRALLWTVGVVVGLPFMIWTDETRHKLGEWTASACIQWKQLATTIMNLATIGLFGSAVRYWGEWKLTIPHSSPA